MTGFGGMAVLPAVTIGGPWRATAAGGGGVGLNHAAKQGAGTGPALLATLAPF
jgi:hypothetical protein